MIKLDNGSNYFVGKVLICDNAIQKTIIIFRNKKPKKSKIWTFEVF